VPPQERLEWTGPDHADGILVGGQAKTPQLSRYFAERELRMLWAEC
jgi:hypothetical protein